MPGTHVSRDWPEPGRVSSRAAAAEPPIPAPASPTPGDDFKLYQLAVAHRKVAATTRLPALATIACEPIATAANSTSSWNSIQAVAMLYSTTLIRSAVSAASRSSPVLPLCRAYSSEPRCSPLDPSRLTIIKTKHPQHPKKPEDLVFGKQFTDHMLAVEWNHKNGWLAPRIHPYQNLSLDPACSVFHYAFECFEGMKAYKDNHGKLRLFRPDMNMARFNKSAARIALPTFEPASLTKLIVELVKLDTCFIPEEKGYSLYLRPTMIGTQPTLGVGSPGSALLYVIASPVGPYYPTGFKAVSLEATDYAVRAWPGGVGDKKLGANYAPCIVPQQHAASRGLQQNLWLFGEEDYVTEVGTMNMFVVIKNKESGQKELITAPLDGTILEGVTRDSVLALARERLVPKGWNVVERSFTMKELVEASGQGRLLEAFGTGTAAIVSPIRNILWKGKKVDCGLKETEESGEAALMFKDWIEAIQYGDMRHPWSYEVS